MHVLISARDHVALWVSARGRQWVGRGSARGWPHGRGHSGQAACAPLGRRPRQTGRPRADGVERGRSLAADTGGRSLARREGPPSFDNFYNRGGDPAWGWAGPAQESGSVGSHWACRAGHVWGVHTREGPTTGGGQAEGWVPP